LPRTTVTNRTVDPAFCGHLLVAVTNPTRWTADTGAWLRDWKILRIANVDVTCPA
jgi:hypothetical protein